MDRVLIRKSDNIPIEYQGGNAPLGTLLQNAVNAGLNFNDYEEKYIKTDEYKILAEEKIYEPARIKKKADKEIKNLPIRIRLKSKLKINDNDLDDLILLIKQGV